MRNYLEKHQTATVIGKTEDLNYDCQIQHLKKLLFVDSVVKPPYLQQQQNANRYKTRHKQGSYSFSTGNFAAFSMYCR